MMSEEEIPNMAYEALNDLKESIDIEKEIIIFNHNFENKLLAIDLIIMHFHENYSHHDDLFEVFLELGDLIEDLRKKNEIAGAGELHILLEEEAAQKKSSRWMIAHRRKFSKEKKQFRRLVKVFLKRLHETIVEVRELFTKSSNLFFFEGKKLVKINIDLDPDEKTEITNIVETLLKVLITYEIFFKEELKKLENK